MSKIFDYGSVWMPSEPVQVTEPTEWQRMYNIFVTSTNSGTSHAKTCDGAAVDLSRTKWGTISAPTTPMFNVTILTERDNKKLKAKASENLHLIGLDHSTEDLIDSNGGIKGDKVMEMENKIIRDIVHLESSDYIDRIKSATGRIDAGFIELAIWEVIASKKLFGHPIIRWLNYQPDPVMSVANYQPWVGYGATLPSLFPAPIWIMYDWGHLNVISRLVADLHHGLQYVMITYLFYGRYRFMYDSPEAIAAHSKLMEDITAGDGIYGMRDIKQDAPNTD